MRRGSSIGRGSLVAAAAVLSAALTCGATTALAASALDRIVQQKTIRVGYIPSPPSNIKDPKTGELSGFYIDAMREICEAAGIKPVFVETKWATFAAGLQAGQFDVTVAGTFATVPRALVVDFTKPIHYLGYSAIVRKGDTRFTTLADIDKPGVKVAVVQGAGSHEYAKRNFTQAELIVLSTGDLTAPFVEVSAGRADVGIEDAWATRKYAAAHPEVTDLFAAIPYNVLPIAWAVRKGDQELLNFLNTALDYLIISGKLEQLTAKYGASGRYQLKRVYEPVGEK